MIASIGQRGRKDGSRQTGMSSALAAQAARPGIQTPYGIMAAGELSTSARPKEHHHAHAPKAASVEPKMDGHDGRDGPRRDGLGTPCDAPRLTVLRASQQQECIDTSSSCKQICRNRASQPESSAAAQQCCSGGCLAGGGGKRSAQPPVLQQHYSQHPSFADTTRRTPAGQHVAYLSLGEAVGYHY